MGSEDYLPDFRGLVGRFDLDILTAVRFMMGWVFLGSGIGKLAESGLNYGYASQYLAKATPVQTPQIAFTFPEVLQIPGILLIEAGALILEPLMVYFASLEFIGAMVVVTELFIGVSLLLGFLTRPGAVLGSFMMLMFYYGNAAWKNGLLNSDFVYLVLIVFIAVSRAGERMRLDSYLGKKYEVENEVLKRVLGL